jgi:hypothetical protein
MSTNRLEATVVNGAAGMLYTGRDVPFSRQNDVGYSPRRNLLERAEEFDNNVWTKTGATVTANTVANPLDGSTTADSLFEVALANIPRINYPVPTTGVQYTWSVYVKDNGRAQIRIVVDGDGSKSTYFTLSGSGTVSAGVSATATITSLGNGWYRCTHTATPALATNPYIATATGNSMIASGDNTKGVYLFGGQWEIGSTATAYQRIGTNPGTSVLFPATLPSPGKSAAGDDLQFAGPVPMNGQAEESNALTFDGVDDFVQFTPADMNAIAGPSTGIGSNLTAFTEQGTVTSRTSNSFTTSGAGGSGLVNTSAFTPGVTYFVEVDVTVSGSLFGLQNSSGTGNPILGSTTLGTGVYRATFTADNANLYFRLGGAGTITINSITIKVLPTIAPVLQTNIIANSGFATDTVWVQGTGWTIGSGVATATSVAAFVSLSQTGLTFIPGVEYRVTYTVVTATAGSVRAAFVGGTQVNGTGRTAPGTYTQDLIAVAGNNQLVLQAEGSGFSGTIDNVTVRALTRIDSKGTSLLRYRSQGDGITGTTGTAFDIKLGTAEEIPCSEGIGANVHGVIRNKEYWVVNGQASNWTTKQNQYHYNLLNGFAEVPLEYPDATAVDSLSDPLTPIDYTDSQGRNWRAFEFLTSGTLNITRGGAFEYLLVGGGGGGASSNAISICCGGGGGGGFIHKSNSLPIGTIAVVVGAGGAGGPVSTNTPGTKGGNTTFLSDTAEGGGFGNRGADNGGNGGSGGGGGAQSADEGQGGLGTVPQGNNGGKGLGIGTVNPGAGGGGGATQVGQNGQVNVGGNGGDGIVSSITGTLRAYAAGGGGSVRRSVGTPGIGGSGIGGNGAIDASGVTDGQVNRGAGGGGGNNTRGGNGGSGVVVVRFRRNA